MAVDARIEDAGEPLVQCAQHDVLCLAGLPRRRPRRHRCRRRSRRRPRARRDRTERPTRCRWSRRCRGRIRVTAGSKRPLMSRPVSGPRRARRARRPAGPPCAPARGRGIPGGYQQSSSGNSTRAPRATAKPAALPSPARPPTRSAYGCGGSGRTSRPFLACRRANRRSGRRRRPRNRDRSAPRGSRTAPGTASLGLWSRRRGEMRIAHARHPAAACLSAPLIHGL